MDSLQRKPPRTPSGPRSSPDLPRNCRRNWRKGDLRIALRSGRVTLDGMPGPVTQTSDETVEYCRRARRLRARFPHQPSRLHRALRELTPTRHERTTPERPTPPTVTANVPPTTRVAVCPAVLLGVPVDQEIVVRRFVEHVRGSLATNPLLTFDHRRQLLRVADRLGVGRFHANLVLAALLHEQGASPKLDVLGAESPAYPKSRMLLTALITQALLVATAMAVWASM